MGSRNPLKDYYKLLGLNSKASFEDVRAAYRRLAKKYHPDVSDSTDAEIWMRLINEAYEILGNPSKRAIYDFVYQAYQANIAYKKAYHSGTVQGYPAQPNKLQSILAEILVVLGELSRGFGFVIFAIFVCVVSIYLTPNMQEFTGAMERLFPIGWAAILLLWALTELLLRSGIRKAESWYFDFMRAHNNSLQRTRDAQRIDVDSDVP
jgi:curved DNA-binding protein CbpA